ncbi:MAG: M20/M25/M40 family metallo-hydrolase [Candidatus Omnitrophota bacterium]
MNFSWKRLIIIILILFLVMRISKHGWRQPTVSNLTFDNQDLLIADNLRNTVKYMSADIGMRDYLNYDNLQKTADFILKSFNDMGYETEIQQYSVDKQVFKNIIAKKVNTNPRGFTIVVGAHYDSCYNPGADDNASGIAGLIELARTLKDKKLKCDIEFIAFVNEEPPFFMTDNMGSRIFAKLAKREREPILAAIILESIGYYSDELNSQDYIAPLGLLYPNKGNFIAVVGNIPSARTVLSIASSFRKNCALPLEYLISPPFLPAVDFSDHWSFWKEGFRAVMITDTAFLRNPNYHTHKDLYNTIDYKRMALVIKGVRAAILDLANK